MTHKVDWFSRGRDAFTEGKPCSFTDARVSGADRQRWHDGYRHQRNLNTPPASEEDRPATIAEIQAIKDLLKSIP